MSEQFDWAADPSIVIQHQPSLAVYLNEGGQVVIRREANWDEEEDSFVQVSPENLVAFLYAVIDEARLPMDLVECTGGGFRDVERPPRTRAEAMEVKRPDINWQAVHEDFDKIEKAERDKPLLLSPPDTKRDAEQQLELIS